MEFKKGSTIVFAGDSITDCGKRECEANACKDNIGCGYMPKIAQIISAKDPSNNIKFINAGISGNTSRDLKNRFQNDVLSYEPDCVFVYIGINDVWRKYGEVNDMVVIEEYEENLRNMLNILADKKIETILITPHFLHLDNNEPMKADMITYANKVKELASEYNLKLIDAQAILDNYIKTNNNTDISGDLVHLNDLGNTVLALGIINS